MSHHCVWTSVLIVLGVVGAPAAQWSSDPQVNLPIADRISEQVIPIPVPTADGGCYVGWFDKASGNYDVYLQRLDAQGVEQWPHNGLLISNHPQASALYGWDLAVDGDDNALLVFPDVRAGGDLDLQVYKISPDGDFLWGADGVTLSSAAGDEIAPAVTVAAGGDVVVAYTWLPLSGDGAIFMQRLSPGGQEQYAHGGLHAAGDPGESPAFPDLVPSSDGDVILSWVRDISSYFSPRYIRAMRFDAVGAAVWPATVAIYDQGPVPLGFRPQIQSDGAGGVLSTWNADEGGLHMARVQRVLADGSEQFPHNGVLVSANTSQHHIAPALAYHPTSGESFVFWDERNYNQTRWGIFGQRLSAAGDRLWGDGGIAFLPVTTVYKTMPRSLPCAGGAMGFWIEEPGGPGTGDVIRAMRVDDQGAQVWSEPIVTLASYPSGKGRLSVIRGAAEMGIVTWEDDRQDFADTYGQNVNADGTLGADPTGVAPTGGPASQPRLASHPNPFRGTTRVSLSGPQPMRGAVLEVRDVTGRRVRSLPLTAETGGPFRATWDGADERGRPLPSGVYHLSLEHGPAGRTTGRVILVR